MTAPARAVHWALLACAALSTNGCGGDGYGSGSGSVDGERGPRQTPPSEPLALEDWLLAGEYTRWSAWSKVGPTLGPGGARVFINDALFTSLSENDDVHPPGAAAVRELYAEDFETLTGVSVLVKVEASPSAESWFCYEQLNLQAASEPNVASTAAPGCAGCHGTASDFVQSTLPLP